MPAPSTRARPSSLSELLDDVLPSRRSTPQEDEATYAEKIEAGDRVLDLARPEESLRVRALSPHIGAAASSTAAG